MVSGKGGVGQTTLSCGLARQLGPQRPQEIIMLLSTDPAHSLGDVLQVPVDNTPTALTDVPNVRVRALDAEQLLTDFRAQYGGILELLVERGSFVAGEDLGPFWEMGWPGLDELMALLEIQRILRDHEADRVVVDMAPSGHTLTLFALMDFLDTLLASLDQFQEKHRYLTQTLSGQYQPDEADGFIEDMRRDLQTGRRLIQDPERTACWVVGIPEPMSFLETQRFIEALGRLQIPLGGLAINRVILEDGQVNSVQAQVLDQFRPLAAGHPVLWVPLQAADILGGDDGNMAGLQLAYGPEAWRQIVSQALPGIDEMLSLITVMDLLERNEQRLIVLDTAPTGHLLRFLAMPIAMGDWLGWIFKLWIKYQDVVGRVEFMGRLRTLRQRVIAAQAKLKDPTHTEFIGVVQNQSAILAEAQRLNQTLTTMGIAQRYIVHNRYESGQDLPALPFPQQTIVRLPALPPLNHPFEQVKAAAHLLFPGV